MSKTFLGKVTDVCVGFIDVFQTETEKHRKFKIVIDRFTFEVRYHNSKVVYVSSDDFNPFIFEPKEEKVVIEMLEQKKSIASEYARVVLKDYLSHLVNGSVDVASDLWVLDAGCVSEK
jgi:hypothetical protein